MSAADNSPNLCNTSTEYVCEDELLTWLQYPVDDVFERNYCSELFGGLLPPTNTEVSKTHTDANPPAQSFSDAGISTCTGSGLSRMSMRKNVGTRCPLRSSSTAEDALALGAARAAGRSLQAVGHDAFNKVRTSMQPQAVSIITTPCCSLKAFDHKDRSVKPKIPVPYASRAPQGKVQNPKVHMANTFSTVKTKHAPFASTLLAAEKSIVVKETHFQPLSHTRQSRSSYVTEEGSVERVDEMYASSHSSKAPIIGNTEVKGTTVTGSSSWDANSSWDNRTSKTPQSYSGGSQTSMSLSFREVTYGGKRKHEDSDLRSEDAQENIMNMKVPRKSSSRRNRVSEVHNLSERNRRNRINDKLKALQDLIPNSSKTDKASVLDEAIEYMKTLQIQLQMVSMRSNMSMTQTMMPLAFPPPTAMHMAPLNSIGLGVPIGHAGTGMGFGIGMSMDMGLVPQCGRATPHQSAPAAMTQYGIPCQNENMASLHDNSQACTNAGLLPTHPSPFVQKIYEPSQHLHPRLLGTHAHQLQQQEQGQHLGYLPNHEHEQQDGLSD